MLHRNNKLIHRDVHGFTALELLISLMISLMMFVLIINHVSANMRVQEGSNMAYQAVDYAMDAKRYAQSHYTVLQQILTTSGQSNGAIATIPFSILLQESLVTNMNESSNSLGQIPCVVFTWGNQGLQGFVYYQATANSKQLTTDALVAGLQAGGGSIGAYQNGVVNGAGHGWSLNATQTAALLIANGDADPSQGVDPDAYQCAGDSIAPNSYVVNLAMLLKLNNQLPTDSALHEYVDTQNALDTAPNSNTMQNPLNMYYQAPDGTITRSNLVFQMNESCVMNPNIPATMQDYDPNGESSNAPNPEGCRNRQLGIHADIDTVNRGGYNMTVTGFHQGGDPSVWQSAARPYVGEVKTAFIQPTQSVAITTPCTLAELGKMARQQIDTNNPDDVNNLYVSQVQCMIHPLCPGYIPSNPTASPPCYMPLNTISITYQGDLAGQATFSCPPGLAAVVPMNSLPPAKNPDIQQVPQAVPQPGNSPGPAGCYWCSWNNNYQVSTTFSCAGSNSSTQYQVFPGLCTQFQIFTHFNNCGQAWDGEQCAQSGGSWGGNYIVTCTNDTSQMSLPLTVP